MKKLNQLRKLISVLLFIAGLYTTAKKTGIIKKKTA
jgi:hypothetical protein